MQRVEVRVSRTASGRQGDAVELVGTAPLRATHLSWANTAPVRP